MRSELRSYPLNLPISNLDIGDWNKVEIVSIPSGVKAYISDKEITNITRAEHLTDRLEVREGNNYSNPISLFLHTDGASLEPLQLRLTAVSQNGKYFENKPLERLKLNDELEEVIIKNTAFSPSSILEQPILIGASFELNTEDINSLVFYSSEALEIDLNNKGVFFPASLADVKKINTKNIQNITFKNTSLNDTTLKILFDGIEKVYPYVNDGYFEIDYVH